MSERLETRVRKSWLTPERAHYIIAIGIFILASVPLLTPFGLPLEISETTQAYYDTVETLKPGDIVIYEWNMGSAQFGEMGAPAIVQLQQLFNKAGVRIIVFQPTSEAPGLFDANIFPALDLKGKVYGIDWINLGFYPGGAVIAALATDPHQLFLKDHYGNALSQYSLWNDYRTGADCEMIIFNEVGHGGSYMTQFQIKWGTTIVGATVAAQYADCMLYYTSGQLKGVLNSLRGGAELEKLTNNPGRGLSAMDAMSTLHLWLILVVVAGNVQYFSKRRREGKR